MSTRSSIWYCSDEKGGVCHIFWELGERVPFGAVPLYLELEREDKQVRIRFPKELAQKVRDFLDPEGFEPL